MLNIEAAEFLRLKQSVHIVSRGATLTLLDDMSLAPALKLPARAYAALEKLRTGVDQDCPIQISNLARQLSKYGLIEGSEMDGSVIDAANRGKLYFANPDRWCGVIATALHRFPPALLQGVLYVVLAFSFCVVAAQVWGWSSGIAPIQASAAGIILYFLLGVPIHEFSHAVACRYAGARISGVGIEFHRRRMPRPFVNTKNLLLISSRRKRAMVCLAGPYSDFVFGTTCVLLFAATGQALFSTAAVCALLFFIMNLTPYRTSDGRNALAEIATDEDGTVRALSRRSRMAATLGYLALLAAMMGVLIPVSLRLAAEAAQRWF